MVNNRSSKTPTEKEGDMFIYNINASAQDLVSIIDWCSSNILDTWYKNDKIFNIDSWIFVREHWQEKIKPDAKFDVKMVFKSPKDATLFKLRYGSYIHND